jgi:hypothetical protein
MDQLIGFLIFAVIFAAIAYGAWWLCVKFQAPRPVFWIVGVILLICLLYFLSGQVSVRSFNFNLRR